MHHPVANVKPAARWERTDKWCCIHFKQMKTSFLKRWDNHASEVAQCVCPYHRDLELIFRGGESTLPSLLLFHRHARTSMPLIPGSAVPQHSLGKSMAMVLHTSTCLQPPEQPHKTTPRNTPLAHSLPWQAMGTAKSAARMPA